MFKGVIMSVFQQGITALQTITTCLGGGICVWGGINLLEGYGADNAASKNQGIKQCIAGGGIIVIATKVLPLLASMLN